MLTRYYNLLILILASSSILFAGENRNFDWIKPGENVWADYIVVEVSPEYFPLLTEQAPGSMRTSCDPLNELLLEYDAVEVEKVFRMKHTPKDPGIPDLSRFYHVYFSGDVELRSALRDFNRCEGIELAEPVPIHRTCFVPNDPRFHAQWYMEHCNFPEAWDLSHGSEEIVIGIVDSGIDMPDPFTIHEDLAENLWRNPGEDIDGDGEITLDDWNGRDDDDNGYPDDFYGWDIVGDHNWPNESEESFHGTFMAGLVSAVTNNEIGVAGAGFSCRLMIAGCRSRRYVGYIEAGYEGIEYCASNGADIINLSWGGFYESEEVERRAIEYALSQGCIVFAAAGNNDWQDNEDDQEHYYPAAYDGVIGVGATDDNDERAEFNREESSNWGDFVDICAPGTNHVSTVPRNSYLTTHGGTSGSSALTSGLAALMLSVMPDLTADEMLERMRSTAVDISDLNQDYTGIEYRIDAGALLNSIHPQLGLVEWSIRERDGDFDGRAERYEHVDVLMTVDNRAGFAEAHGVTLTLENDDQFILVPQAGGEIGDLEGGESIIVPEDEAPMFYVQWNSPPHYTIFTLTLDSEEGFPTVLELPLTVGQPLYLLADDDGGSRYQNYYRADLDSLSMVYDALCVDDDGLPELEWISDFSFVIWETGTVQTPLSDLEQRLLQNYLDSGGSLLLTSQYVGDDLGESDFLRDYLHVRHLNDNTGEAQLSGVEGNPITDGMSLLLIGGNAANNNESPGSMEPLDGAQPLFTYDRSGEVAGIYYSNDVYQVIYLGFPLEAASGLANTTLRQDFIESALGYFYEVGVDEPLQSNIPAKHELSVPFPNPFNDVVKLRYSLSHATDVKLGIHDLSGREVAVLREGNIPAGWHSLSWEADDCPTGIYIVRLTTPESVSTRKIMLLR